MSKDSLGSARIHHVVLQRAYFGPFRCPVAIYHIARISYEDEKFHNSEESKRENCGPTILVIALSDILDAGSQESGGIEAATWH